MNEGGVDGVLGIGVEEAEEAEAEDQSSGEIAPFEGEIGTEEEGMQPLQLLVHLLSPTSV